MDRRFMRLKEGEFKGPMFTTELVTSLHNDYKKLLEGRTHDQDEADLRLVFVASRLGTLVAAPQSECVARIKQELSWPKSLIRPKSKKWTTWQTSNNPELTPHGSESSSPSDASNRDSDSDVVNLEFEDPDRRYYTPQESSLRSVQPLESGQRIHDP